MARSSTDRAFRAEIVLMGEIWSGKCTKGFRSSLVRMHHTLGMRVEVQVALVDEHVFNARMGMPPDSIGSTAAMTKLFELTDEEGQDIKAIAMSFRNLPKDLPHRIGIMYSSTETLMAEIVLAECDQLRRGQVVSICSKKDGHKWGVCSSRSQCDVGRGLCHIGLVCPFPGRHDAREVEGICLTCPFG